MTTTNTVPLLRASVAAVEQDLERQLRRLREERKEAVETWLAKQQAIHDVREKLAELKRAKVKS